MKNSRTTITQFFRRNYSLFCVIPALAAAISPACARQLSAAKGLASDVQVVTPDLNADARMDVAAMDKYEAAVRNLLQDRKFGQLDEIADSARTGKTRFAGGNWKLYIFYRALKEPLGGYTATETVWQAHIANLQTWAERNPQSVTAWIALAETYFEYSQKAIVDGIQPVPPDQPPSQQAKQAVNTRRHSAQLALQEAEQLKTKCPHYYFVKQKMAGEPNQALLDEAVAAAPDYYYYYQMQALFLHIYPEDENHNDDAETFADQTAAKIGGDEGPFVYYEIAAAINGNPHLLWPYAKFPWEKIVAAYAALERKYGSSVFKKNQMAYIAMQQLDTLAAKPFFAEIGNQWDQETWKSKANFESYRNWSMSSPEFASILQVGMANYKTSGGQQYYDSALKVYRQFAKTIWKSCAQQLNGDLGGSFDLLLLVGEDGTIQKTQVWPQTKASACVTPGLLGQRLPSPPSPSYWLRVPVPMTQPEPTTTAASH